MYEILDNTQVTLILDLVALAPSRYDPPWGPQAAPQRRKDKKSHLRATGGHEAELTNLRAADTQKTHLPQVKRSRTRINTILLWLEL